MAGQTTKTTYKAALYCRLSKDDGKYRRIQTYRKVYLFEENKDSWTENCRNP